MLDQELHFLLLRAFHHSNRLITQQIAVLGLYPGQPKILEYLAEYGEHEQKDIATYREIEPATVGSILQRMETAGLIARRNRPDNRRSLYVSLTPKGEEMARTMRDVFAAAEAQVTAGLSEEERAALLRLLSKCVQNRKGNCE